MHWGPQQCKVGSDLRTGPIRLGGDQEKLCGGGGSGDCIASWMESKLKSCRDGEWQSGGWEPRD